MPDPTAAEPDSGPEPDTGPEPDRGPAPDAGPLLRPGARFEGLLVLHGAARIDGAIEGRVLGAEVLQIGEAGRVEARIDAEEVVVAGTVVGDITASRRVELQSTARVRGRLEAPRVSLAAGCSFDGPCRTTRAPGVPEADGKAPGTA